MVIRISIKRILLMLLFLFFLFQQAFLNYTEGTLNKLIGYADEVFACGLIMLVLFMFFIKRARLTKVEVGILGCYIVFLIWGFLSNLFHPMQSWFLNFSDMLVCSRFLAFYFGARLLLNESVNYEKLLRDLAFLCRVIAIVFTLLVINEIFFDPIFPKKSYRYFMYSQQLFFPNQTYLAAACMTCASVLMASIHYCSSKREINKNLICIAIFLIITCMTLRSKAIATAACSAGLYFMIVKGRIKAKTLLIGGVGIIAVLIGWDQFLYYYTTDIEGFARIRLTLDSVNLANSYFPFGTGFATFGSAIAAEHYSPLYTMLGYEYLHGGSSATPKFLSDTFWPTVLAQNGWIGAIAFIGIVLSLMYITFWSEKRSRYIFWAMMTIMIYLLIASLAESAFFNPIAALFMGCFGLMVNICMQEKPKRLEKRQ